MYQELFQTFALEWNLTENDIQSASKLLAQDNPAIESPDKLLLFLYAKGILAEEEEENFRNIKFHALLKAKTDKLKKSLERLKIIVETGEKSPKRANWEPKSMFDEFVEKHPEWAAGKSFVVFRDHQDLKGKSHALVERVQKSGLCYMHACVVVQHYLVAMNNTEKIPMLDMAEYLKKYMPRDHLYERIWNNKGGDSLDFLKNILKKKLKANDAFHCMNQYEFENMDKQLSEYGPGLVSGFCVTENFTTPEWVHVGEYADEKFLGRHAMVLVGYRTVGGKKHYLLQNWWKTKTYIEVDVDYLQSSNAIIHFIKEKQTEMGDYPQNYDILVECESGIDASENFIPDGCK